MPLILSGNVASATADAGYTVANSCRFNDGDSPYLSRTFAGAGDLDKWTFSCWYKRSAISSSTQRLFSAGSNNTTIYFTSSDQLHFYDAALDTGWGVQDADFRLFRDPSAWYHIVWTLDSAQAVAANRVKCYVNGTQQTLTKSGSGGDQNFTTAITTAVEHFISKRPTHSTGYLDGYLAEVCFCDGQAYAASDFGEFDEDSPTIWKPKDVSGLTFGTNGFYLDFEDSANLGNDANGGTDWDETNLAATDQATDTPTNNFATLNPLDAGSEATLSEGNCKYTGGTTIGQDQRQVCGGTFGVSKGKWYYEVKKIAAGDYNDATVGIYAAEHVGANIGYTSVWGSAWNNLMLGCFTQSGNAHSGNASTSYGDSLADDEILGVALDLDNGAIYFSEEGTFYDSGDPTSGASKTGAASNFSTSVDTWILPFIADGSSGVAPVFEFNFGGCPAFTVSSGNSDANGYGNFEFAPPSGYYAPCSKNLAEFG